MTGFLIGLVVSVKLSGFIFMYLLIPLFYYEKKYLKEHLLLQSLVKKIGMFTIVIVLVFSSVYYVHGLLGQHILDNRYFSASDEYKKIIADKQTYNPLYLPVIIRDNLIATKTYGDAIPKYNPAFEAQQGTASLPYTWPFGDKSINYRWESIDGNTRYLYLLGNPVIWFVGLLGIICTIALLVAVYICKRTVRNKRLFFLLQLIFILYLLHMSLYLYLSLERVLFLYTYFIPLLLSLILSFIIYIYMFENALIRKDKRLYGATLIFVILVILAFWFFSPLTYYQPLTKQEFLMRSLFPFWHLKPV